MSALRLSRRGLFGGIAALLAAPAIVRVASIMPVKAVPDHATLVDLMNRRIFEAQQAAYEELIREPTAHFDWVQYDVRIAVPA